MVEIMKTIQLIIIGFFCLLPVLGQEYKPDMITYDDWLRIEDVQQPFQDEYEAFRLNKILADQENPQPLSAEDEAFNLNNEHELGAKKRNINVSIGDNIPIFLLFSFIYCLKYYKKRIRKTE